jgi:GTP-binding protein
VLDTHPPPTSGGKAPRLYYVTQAESSPPAFIAVSNWPDAIHFSYRRFVVNQLRKHFGFEGVPVRMFYKPKKKRERLGAAPDKRLERNRGGKRGEPAEPEE